MNRQVTDIAAKQVTFGLSLLVIFLMLTIGVGLFLKAKPVLAHQSLTSIISSTNWHPSQHQFGLGGFIVGTLWVTLIAIVLAVPLSLLTAIFLSEYAPRRLREVIKPLVDLLAGISPVIFGVWGVVAVVPLVRDHLMPLLSEKLPFFPFVSENYTGFSALTAGIVLAVMTVPIILSIMDEVLRGIPFEVREASLALGATRWQTIKKAVLKKAWPGFVAAIILGLSRAFGETIAVLMVAGCSLGIWPKGVFDPAYPLPALIANTYGEMMSVPLYESAIMMAAFILLLVTVVFNMIGWGILLRLESKGY